MTKQRFNPIIGAMKKWLFRQLRQLRRSSMFYPMFYKWFIKSRFLVWLRS